MPHLGVGVVRMKLNYHHQITIDFCQFLYVVYLLMHQSLMSEHYKQGRTVRDLNIHGRTLCPERSKIDFGSFSVNGNVQYNQIRSELEENKTRVNRQIL